MSVEDRAEYRRQLAELDADDPQVIHTPSWWKGPDHASQVTLAGVQALQALHGEHRR